MPEAWWPAVLAQDEAQSGRAWGPPGYHLSVGPLDAAIWKDVRGLDAAGKEGLVRGLLDAFLAEMAPLIAAVRQALGEGSAGGLASAAHAIKGAAANLGAPALAALSARLEKHGRSGTLPEVKALAQELEREFRRVCQVMEGELGHQAARLVRARHAPAGTPRPDVAADPRVGRRVGRGVRQLPKE